MHHLILKMSQNHQHIFAVFSVKCAFSNFGFNPKNESATHGKINALQFKILETKSITKFLELFSENVAEFTPNVISFSAKTITILLDQTRGAIMEQPFRAFNSHVLASDVSKLNEKELMSYFSLLRQFDKRNIRKYDKSRHQFRKVLMARFSALLRQNQSKNIELNILNLYYFEMSSLRNGSLSTVIAVKIARQFEEDLTRVKSINANPSQISFLLHGLTQRDWLSNPERKVLGFLVNKINEECNNIKINDLVNIGIGLNFFDSSEWSRFELVSFRKVTNRIQLQILDLEESSIFALLRVDRANSYEFYLIYQKLIENFFGEINENGQSTIKDSVLANIFMKLSSKFHLKAVSEVNQSKFFAFMEKFHESEQKKLEKTFFFSKVMENLVENQFFNSIAHEKVIKILKNVVTPVTWRLLWVLSQHRFNIGQCLKSLHIKQVKDQKRQDKMFFYILTITTQAQLNPGNFELQEEAKKVKEMGYKFYESPEVFTANFWEIMREEKNDSMILRLHEVFEESFKKLPNPFIGKNNYNERLYSSVESFNKYLHFYMKYVLKGFKHRDLMPFIQSQEPIIPTSAVIEQLRVHLKVPKHQIDFKLYYLQLINARFRHQFLNKNKEYFMIIPQFFYKYSRVYTMMLNDIKSEYMYKILHKCIGIYKEYSSCPELSQVLPELENLYENILSKNYKNYRVEVQFKKVVKHLLSKLSYLKNRNLIKALIRNGLDLNLIEDKHLVGVDVSKLSISLIQKQSLLNIQDKSFIPQIDKINLQSLKIIFRNQNTEKLIQKEEKTILAFIEGADPYVICELIPSFLQKKSNRNVLIFKTMIETALKKYKRMEGIDCIGIIRFFVTNGYQHFTLVRKFAETIMSFYTPKLNFYTIESHATLIRFINCIPNISLQEYADKILLSPKDLNTWTMVTWQRILVGLIYSKFQFAEEKLQTIINWIHNNNPRLALKMLVFYQKCLNEKYFREVLVKICDSVNKTIEKEDKFNKNALASDQGQINEEMSELNEKQEKQFVYYKDSKSPFSLAKIIYNYLKSVYPEETSKLELQDARLNNYRFSHEVSPIVYQRSFGLFEEFLNEKIEMVSFDLELNKIYKIKNILIFFFTDDKPNAIYEKESLKRIMRHGLQLKENQIIVCIDSKRPKHIIDAIRAEQKELISNDDYHKIINRIEEMERDKRDRFQDKATTRTPEEREEPENIYN